MNDYSRFRTEAKLNLPAGFYVLSEPFTLQPDDLVWSWSSQEWRRGDDPNWITSPLIYSEDIICAARKIAISEFERSVPNKKSYTIK